MADLNGQIDMQTLLATPCEHSFAHAPVGAVPNLRAPDQPTTRAPRRSRSRRVRRYAADLPPAPSLSLVTTSPAPVASPPNPEFSGWFLMSRGPSGASGSLSNGPQEKIFCVREGKTSE